VFVSFVVCVIHLNSNCDEIGVELSCIRMHTRCLIKCLNGTLYM
jgi:hypothetical protein